MVNDKTQTPESRGNNVFGVLVGLFVGSVAGATAMLLLAPQSGEKTRAQLQEKGTQLRDRAAAMVEEGVSQVRSNAEKITSGGREKLKELKQPTRPGIGC